MLIYDFFTFLW